MIRKILLLLLLVIPVVAAQAEDYSARDSLLMRITFDANVDFIQKEPNGKVLSLDAVVSYLPLNDDRQTVRNLKVTTNPEAKYNIEGRNLKINWENPDNNGVSYGFSADVETQNEFSNIGKKTNFPLNVEGEELRFTAPTKYIDTNDDIKALANKFAEGKDDEWEVVIAAAEWTRTNIKYDLNTLTASVVKPSSWVLTNREGVCDELTNLFISFLRSLGIPARFVSGVVYSNIGNEWGGHGWAEVYFPGEGWVPFDVTFGQYGWLDATHIKLKDDIDSGAASAKYSWSEENVDVKVGELKIDTKLLTDGTNKESPISISVEPLASKVGFGSYVPTQIDVENMQDHYLSEQLIVTKAPGLTEKNVKIISLKPKQKKSLFWIVEVPDNLNEGYEYTGVIEVRDSFFNTESAKLTYSAKDEVFTKERAEKLVQSLSRETMKPNFNDLGFKCITEDKVYYEKETTQVKCMMKNHGGKVLAFDVCVKITCESITLGANQEKESDFSYTLSKSGRIVAVASNDDFANYAYIDLNVIGVPSITINDFQPAEVDYNKAYVFKFILVPSEKIKNLKLEINHGKLDVGELEEERTFTFEINSRFMLDGADIKADYEDVNGKAYHSAEHFDIKILNQPWYARILFWVTSIF